jgi:NAD(P)-dependent dehydrogenase (short-subunit alcohol dehydrogenase family)
VAVTSPAARKFARAGVRVVTIAPGLFHTPIVDGLPPDVRASLGAGIPFPSRFGKTPARSTEMPRAQEIARVHTIACGGAHSQRWRSNAAVRHKFCVYGLHA